MAFTGTNKLAQLLQGFVALQISRSPIRMAFTGTNKLAQLLQGFVAVQISRPPRLICVGPKYRENTNYSFFPNVCCVLACYMCLCCSVCVFYTGNCVMLPLNSTCPHCFQYSFFEHLINL